MFWGLTTDSLEVDNSTKLFVTIWLSRRHCLFRERKEQLVAVGIVDLERVVPPPAFLVRNGTLDELTAEIGDAVRREPNSSRSTSFKSTCFDSPANTVGPWPASELATHLWPASARTSLSRFRGSA